MLAPCLPALAGLVLIQTLFYIIKRVNAGRIAGRKPILQDGYEELAPLPALFVFNRGVMFDVHI